jgi:uncharacterized caspase-like protein
MGASKITVSRYALSYGVSIYLSSIGEGQVLSYGGVDYSNLSYPDEDAADMTALLAGQGWTAARRVRGYIGGASTLTDEYPTKANIEADVSALAATAASDSEVVLFFSGHGVADANGKAYLVPYLGVVDSSTPSVDLSMCISPEELSSMLAWLPTKNVIVLLDCCDSGGFVSSSGAIDASPQNYASSSGSYSAFSTALGNFGSLLAANASPTGAKVPIVISGAGSQEFNYESQDLGHGIFTYYLLASATKGDADGDGIVTTTEAYAYIVSAINSNWNQSNANLAFLPHISGDTRDLALFSK